MSDPQFEKYEELDHTADVGLRVRGATLEELCENAAAGMFSLIGEATFEPGELEKRRVDVGCAEPDECLFLWLRALLLAFALDGLFVVETKVESAEGRFFATIRGGRFDPRQHTFLTELKAVTRHGLRVVETPDGFEAEVIFDV